MKVLRILGGLAAGTAAGLAVTAFNKDQSKTSQGEFDDSTPVSYTHLTLPTTPYV